MDGRVVQYAGEADQTAQVEEEDVGVLPANLVAADAFQHLGEGAFKGGLCVVLELVREVKVGIDQPGAQEGDGVFVFDPVPVGHPEEVAVGVRAGSEILIVQDFSKDAIGLPGIVRAVGAVVRVEQEDGVFQRLLPHSMAVEAREERVPAHEERRIRVVDAVAEFTQGIAEKHAALALAAYGVCFHDRRPLHDVGAILVIAHLR